MRTLGQLLICVLLAVPSAHAAFGPWDVELDRATRIARTFEHHFAMESNRLAVYLEWPAQQLRALVGLPVIRELTRMVGLRALQAALATPAPVSAHPRPCPHRG